MPEPLILIGRPETATTRASEELLDGCIMALQPFDTETLRAIAEERDEINPGGWMQAMIRGYLEVWR